MTDHKGSGDADFAQQYADRIIQRIFETGHWGVADALFRKCPKEHLPNVAFIFLHHFVSDGTIRKGDMH